MFLSLHGSMVAWRLDWREMARLASETGYAGIDMPRGSAQGEIAAEAHEFLITARIRPSIYPLPVEYRTSQDAFESGFATMNEAAAFAARIGCAAMTTWLPASTIWPKREAWNFCGRVWPHARSYWTVTVCGSELNF